MADLDHLFGSDSDDDDDFQPKAQPAREAAEANQDVAEPEEALEEEDEDAVPLQQTEQYEGDSYRDGEPERPVGPPLSLDAPSVRPLGGGDTRLVKLSNILNIETRPFDPAAYEPAAEEAVVDESGKRRVRLRDQNVIRWRARPGPDGVPAIESNARFVRWSDGSLQLLVGDEVLDVAELDMSRDNNFLFLRHIQAQLLEAQGRFERKLAFRPASLNSRFHKRLARAVDRSHTKASRVRKWNAVSDPAKEKAERERAEEARIRATEQLERRQNKEMRRYSAQPRSEGRPRGAAGLTAQYLEAVGAEDEYESDGDDYDDNGAVTATERARANLARRSVHDERDVEERLARAKRAPPPQQAQPPAKRPNTTAQREEEDSDLDLGDLSPEDDEEAVGAARGAQRRQARGLVLSDDDDE